MNVGIRQPYLRVLGISVDTTGPGRSTGVATTPAEEDRFRHLASSPNVYEQIAKSIAPSIFGSLDIKKAIACLLFGGSRKRWANERKVGFSTVRIQNHQFQRKANQTCQNAHSCFCL